MVPNGWDKYPIGKICSSIVPGRNKPKQFGGDIPWVTTPEIIGKYIPSSVQENYISEETIKECGGKIVPKGAVVMAAVGDLGLIAIAKEKIVLNQQLHAFVCSSKINNEFLAYWLATQTPYMESVASKTTILYLNKTNCESIPVLVPPLPEQQKIAKILSAWDKAISTTERLIDNSTQQKKALMQQLLTGKKRLLDYEGKRFEGEWERLKLEDVVIKTQLGTSERTKDVEEASTIPLIKMGNLTWGGFSFDKLETLPKSKVDESLILKSGDFLFNTRNTPELVGKSAVWKEQQVEATFDNNINRITFNRNVDTDFMCLYLTYGKGKSLISSLSAGSTSVAAIYWKDLKNIKLPVPTLSEQQKIASVLTNADKEIEFLEQQLADLQQEKKALMQQLLTGKKRVLVDGEGG